MDVPFRTRARAAACAWLLAAAALGAIDALIAARQSAGIAPGRTLPLCLTAPFPIALVVLAPAAFVAVLLPLGARAAAAFANRVGGPRLRRWVAVAAVLHAAALAGVVWQVQREGRGVTRDVLAVLARRHEPARPALAAERRAGEGRDSGGAPHNLILVTVDTLRADHIDDANMPRTSALARDGVRFAQAFAASSWTLPSVASLLTGLPAARHGAGAPLGPDPLSRAALGETHATLATELRGAGFTTRAIVTNPYLGLGYGLGRGFDAYENVTLESEAVLTLRPTFGFTALAWLFPPLAIADRGDAVTARAARFLRGPHEGRFFLWLHYVDPHAPYDGATRSFRDELLAGGGTTTRLPRMAQLRAGEIRPDAAGRVALREAYARAVRFADEQIGAIAELLGESGLAGRTLLVVTADHGEELWDHGGVEHGHTLYDEVVRVPLVLRCPGCAPRGLRVEAPVATASLAPTLLDLLGVAVSAGDPADASALRAANGFAPLLRGTPWTPAPIVSENLLFAEDRIALRTARHTYVTWPNGKEELYDRARDPRELRDVGARASLLRRHRALLAAERAAPDDGADAAVTSAPPAHADARLRSALAALGYVE